MEQNESLLRYLLVGGGEQITITRQNFTETIRNLFPWDKNLQSSGITNYAKCEIGGKEFLLYPVLVKTNWIGEAQLTTKGYKLQKPTATNDPRFKKIRTQCFEYKGAKYSNTQLFDDFVKGLKLYDIIGNNQSVTSIVFLVKDKGNQVIESSELIDPCASNIY